MRLGGSNDPLEPFPQKPRRMHWRTYRRLRNEAKAAKAEADYLLAKSLPGLAQLLDLVPLRQKRQRGRRDGRPKPPPAAGSPSTPSRPDRPNCKNDEEWVWAAFGDCTAIVNLKPKSLLSG
jgi:hypothetical protein